MTAIASREMTTFVGSLRKNRDEEIRISVEPFRGREVLNIRVWWLGRDGVWRPSQKGLALTTDKLGDLLAMLAAAYRVVSPTWDGTIPRRRPAA